MRVRMRYTSAAPISPFAVKGWPRLGAPVAALKPVKDGISGKPKTPTPEQMTRSQDLQGFTARIHTVSRVSSDTKPISGIHTVQRNCARPLI